MGDVINLNRFRKKKAREVKERTAETNRRLHGRTNAERAREAAQKARLEKGLDGAFLGKERVAFDDIPGIGRPGAELVSIEGLRGDVQARFEQLEAAAAAALPMQDLKLKSTHEKADALEEPSKEE